MSKPVRVNGRIRIREVRLIDEAGRQLGIVPTPQALAVARERGLDLVEVAPNASPPACRIMDYGKARYEQSRKERESRRNARGSGCARRGDSTSLRSVAQAFSYALCCPVLRGMLIAARFRARFAA